MLAKGHYLIYQNAKTFDINNNSPSEIISPHYDKPYIYQPAVAKKRGCFPTARDLSLATTHEN